MLIDNKGKNSISRRKFLKRLSHLAIFLSASGLIGSGHVEMVAADEEGTKRKLFAFGDEGRWPTSESFTVGFLYTERPDKHRHRIQELRKKHSYFRMLKYDCTCKYKVQYAADLLKYFFDEPDLRFIAKVAGEAEASEKFHYKNLVDRLAPHKLKVHLTLKNHGRVGGGKAVRDFLEKEILRIDGITVARQRNDDLMQLADFLTGNVALDAARFQNTGASNHKVKTALLKTLQGHLKVSSLLQDSLKNGSKFRVLHA